MRSILPLILGLLIGAAGSALFVRSLPPEKDSTAETVIELRREIERKELRIAELEQSEIHAAEKLERLATHSKLSIMRDIRDGRTVDINDVFNAAKPFLHGFSPFFDRVRKLEQRKSIERTMADLTKTYQLDDAQQAAITQWMQQRADEHMRHWQEVTGSEQSTMEDFTKATQDFKPREGLDELMEQQLSGDALARYRQDRLEERVNRVQYEADRRVEQLDGVVSLDEGQKDQVFSLMARSSRDFDSSMSFEGLGDDATVLPPGESRDEAVLSVLSKDQRQRYEAHRQEQRRQAEADMRELGLRLPPNWDIFGE